MVRKKQPKHEGKAILEPHLCIFSKKSSNPLCEAALKSAIIQKRKLAVLLIVLANLLVFIICACFFIPALKNHDTPLIKKIRVGISPKYNFYCYKDDDGLFKGFNIDLLNALSLEMGTSLEFCEIPENEVILSMITHRVDCVYGMRFDHIPSEYIVKTKPFFDNRLSMFVRKGTNVMHPKTNINEKRVAISEDDPYVNIVDNSKIVRLFKANSTESAIDLLLYGIADVYIGDKYIGIDYIKNTSYKDKIRTIGDKDFGWMSTLVVLKDDSPLVSWAENGYKTVCQKNILDKIKHKWLGKGVDEGEKIIKKILVVVFVAIIVVLTVIYVLYTINNMLKKEVAQRTFDIYNEKKLNASIIESLFDGLVYLDANRRVVLTNTSAQNIIGDGKEIVNRDFFSLEGSAAFNAEDLNYVIENKDKIIGAENNANMKKSAKFIKYNMTPVINEDGELNGITLAFRDITEEKKTMQKLIYKDKLESLGALIAGVAHEMRNSLTAISMYVKLFPQKMNNPAFRDQIATDIPKEVCRLENMVKNLLDYACPAPLKRENLNLKNEIDSTIRLFLTQLKTNINIKVRIDINENIKIFFDKRMFKQIVINLIVNSYDALQKTENPEICIAAEENMDGVILSVEDNGSGISSEAAPKIFQPFFTTKSGGYGLGLSIVSHLVMENQADIMLDSDFENGTRFIITIPDADTNNSKGTNGTRSENLAEEKHAYN